MQSDTLVQEDLFHLNSRQIPRDLHLKHSAVGI